MHGKLSQVDNYTVLFLTIKHLADENKLQGLLTGSCKGWL